MFTVRVSAHSRHSGVICDHSHPSGWKVVPLSSWFWFAFSWRANDGDHIFVGLVAVCVCVCVCLFRKCLCSTFAHFLNWVVFFVCVIRILYYIPDISPLLGMWFTDIFSCSLFFFFLLGQHPWYMEVPRLGVKSELQLLANATATATPDLSHVCDLHHSSQQRQILNPLFDSRESNLRPHGSQSDSFPLHHNGNSSCSLSRWCCLQHKTF